MQINRVIYVFLYLWQLVSKSERVNLLIGSTRNNYVRIIWPVQSQNLNKGKLPTWVRNNYYGSRPKFNPRKYITFSLCFWRSNNGVFPLRISHNFTTVSYEPDKSWYSLFGLHFTDETHNEWDVSAAAATFPVVVRASHNLICLSELPVAKS